MHQQGLFQLIIYPLVIFSVETVQFEHGSWRVDATSHCVMFSPSYWSIMLYMLPLAISTAHPSSGGVSQCSTGIENNLQVEINCSKLFRKPFLFSVDCTSIVSGVADWCESWCVQTFTVLPDTLNAMQIATSCDCLCFVVFVVIIYDFLFWMYFCCCCSVVVVVTTECHTFGMSASLWNSNSSYHSSNTLYRIQELLPVDSILWGPSSFKMFTQCDSRLSRPTKHEALRAPSFCFDMIRTSALEISDL